MGLRLGVLAIESCRDTAIKNTRLESWEDIQNLLEQPVTSFTVEDSDVSVPLCPTHYNLYTPLNLSSEACRGKP